MKPLTFYYIGEPVPVRNEEFKNYWQLLDKLQQPPETAEMENRK